MPGPSAHPCPAWLSNHTSFCQGSCGQSLVPPYSRVLVNVGSAGGQDRTYADIQTGPRPTALPGVNPGAPGGPGVESHTQRPDKLSPAPDATWIAGKVQAWKVRGSRYRADIPEATHAGRPGAGVAVTASVSSPGCTPMTLAGTRSGSPGGTAAGTAGRWPLEGPRFAHTGSLHQSHLTR